MVHKRKKLTKKQKGYVKIIIANIIFFGSFMVGFIWERSLEGVQYSGLFFFFFIAVIPYSIWYGFYSYRATEQIALPNFLLGLFGLTFIPIFVVLSVISSIVTKLVIEANRKSTKKMLALQAQEIAEFEEPTSEEPTEE